MNRLILGVAVIVVIIVGVLAWDFLASHRPVSAPVTSSTSQSTTTSTTSTSTKMKNTGPLTGTILYEIIAPAEIDGENYTYIWLVVNITNPSNTTMSDVVGLSYLNGEAAADFEIENYPFGAPNYEPIVDEMHSDSLGPKQSAVGWIAFKINGYRSSFPVDYLELSYYPEEGSVVLNELYVSYLYPAPNFTVIHADQVIFGNSSVSLAEYPFTNWFFIVPNVKVTIPIGIGFSVTTNITNVTITGFSSPLIEAFNLPMTVNITNLEAYANITLELTHYVPYAVTTYIYVKQ